MFFASCSGSASITGISMASEEIVEVPFGNFSYDGINVNVNYDNGKSVTIALTSEMIPVSEQLKFYKMGEQDITVSFRDRYTTTMKINVVLNSFKDIYKLDDLTVTYDGLPHTVKLSEELPEGATIEYPYGNVFTATGTYEIVGVISKTGYESKTVNATLTINPAEHETGKITFNDATFVYNGEMKTVEATNVPEGVKVDYEIREYTTDTKINKIVNVGKYKVTAKFTDTNTNYKKIDDMVAVVTVNKGDYDMSSYAFSNILKVYDNQEYDAHITNENKLPTGVSVKYKYYKDGALVTSNKACGMYIMYAEFTSTDKNYNPIESMEATLIVDKVQVSLRNKVYFDGATWTYGETPVPLEIILADDFPAQYASSYQYTFIKVDDGTEYHDGDYQYAGHYTIKCEFVSTDDTVQFIVDNLVSAVVINPINQAVTVEELTITYDDVTHEYFVDPTVVKTTEETPQVITEKIIVQTTEEEKQEIYFYTDSERTLENRIEIADFVPGETYYYTVALEYENANLASSIIINDYNGTYTVPIV